MWNRRGHKHPRPKHTGAHTHPTQLYADSNSYSTTADSYSVDGRFSSLFCCLIFSCNFSVFLYDFKFSPSILLFRPLSGISSSSLCFENGSFLHYLRHTSSSVSSASFPLSSSCVSLSYLFCFHIYRSRTFFCFLFLYIFTFFGYFLCFLLLFRLYSECRIGCSVVSH